MDLVFTASNGAAAGRLPASCTLTGQDGPDRLARWQALNDQFLLGHVRGAGRLTGRYRRTEAAVTELNSLVVAERACCAFLDWTLHEQPAAPDEVQLLITGRDEDLDVLFA